MVRQALRYRFPLVAWPLFLISPLGLQSGKRFIRLPPPKMQPFHGLGHRKPIAGQGDKFKQGSGFALSFIVKPMALPVH